MKRMIPALQVGALGLALTSAAQAQELVLYTASNEQIEKEVIEAFKSAHPEVTVQNVNMSTGPITQRLIAEAANPQADVVWMVNDIALQQLKQAGVLEPYEPSDSAVLDAFKDPDGFYLGHNATIMAMAVNTEQLERRGLPMPKGWVDLIKPEYKGAITVASPTKSGTGLSIFATLLDAFGWNFIDNLHQNIFQYNDSGSAAVRQAVSGETAIGLTYDAAILQQMREGTPIEMVIGEISPNVMEGAALIANAPHPEEARLFLDWLFSDDGAAVLGPHIGIGAVPGYGSIDPSEVYLWQMRRPLDPEEFKREWSAKYEG
ncbi:MAG TPA: extracellular solute-binding protein [Thermomicrobiales bacterium]|nr:extracellular solute-binding protein [Thermomicrobiales bacterium]